MAFRRWYRFFCAPEIHFVVECLFWALYLLIYSYATLLKPRSWRAVIDGHSRDSAIEILSVVFVLSHVIQEVSGL
jgi:hypothetical protein